MKPTCLFLASIVALCYGQDVSYRMRSLGTDLVLLVPDQETDVWQSAVFLENPLIGASFNNDEEIPVTLSILTRRVGVCGMYWPQYQNSLIKGIEKRSHVEDRLKSVFLWRVRGIGLLVSPEMYRLLSKKGDASGYREYHRYQNFVLRTSVGVKVGSKFYAIIEPAYALWERFDATQDYEERHQDVLMPSGRVSLLFRRVTQGNAFSTAFFRFGGPTSIAEVEKLPLDPFIYVMKREDVMRPLCNSATVDFGLARGLPINDESFVVLGICEDVRVGWASTEGRFGPVVDSIRMYMTNESSLPIAVEYVIDHVAVRFGAHFDYCLDGWETETEYGAVRRNYDYEMIHSFNYGYSFGLGWRPGGRFAVDLCNGGDLASLRTWALQLKYSF